jgi:tetratricopeptide (TPR) repeat protein
LLGGFFYWFLHGSVDWLWEYPALTAPAVAWLAAAARGDPGPAGPPRRRELRFLWLAPAAAALVVLAFPWLAAREVRAATDTWQGHTQRAFDRLDLAERLNPLSDKASVVEGMIAVRTHRDERARQAFAQALDRNPSGWFPRLELAVLDSQSSRYAQARRQLEAALRLNPREPVLHLARATVDDKEPMEQSEVDRTLLGAIQLLTGGTQR